MTGIVGEVGGLEERGNGTGERYMMTRRYIAVAFHLQVYIEGCF